MNIEIPKKATEIIKSFEKAGYEIYIVGGAVRDLLTNKSVYDWDFTTNATPEQMLKLFGEDAYYTNKFGTVGIPDDDEENRPYEITTYRTEEGYSDSRRPDKISWGKTLKQDLERRDFTINAMAIAANKSNNVEEYKKNKKTFTLSNSYTLIDLYNGQEDLKNKLIRAVGDPVERFGEDALRMMRAVRIATELNFEIEENTLIAIQKNAKLIHKISKERVKEELIKIMKSNHPYEGMLLFKRSGLLKEILPDLVSAFDVDQKSPNRHHIYDVGTHCFLSLKYVAERNANPIVRFATLIHDIGKVKTVKKLDNGTITFYNHEIVGARIARDIANYLRFSNEEKDKLWKLVRYHQFTVGENQTDSAIRRFIKNVGVENLSDLIDLRIGDRLGSGSSETSWRFEDFKNRLIEVQKQPFTVRDLKISGTDVMKTLNLKPSPKVGEILSNLFDKVIEKKIENTKSELQKELLNYKNK